MDKMWGFFDNLLGSLQSTNISRLFNTSASEYEKSIPTELKELLQSNHNFARDIYQILASENENVIFSPISLQIALLLTLKGAQGKTAEEMKTSLNLSKENDVILQGAHLLMENLKTPNLKIASQIFIDQQYNLKSTYESLMKQYFESTFESVDFQHSSGKETEKINSWVAEKTEKKITNLITPGVLGEWTRLVLVNAVHFKDEWNRKFSESGTYNESFYSSEDKFVDIPMMHCTDRFKYLEEKLYRVLEIPYKNQEFRFLILLPKEIEGLRQLDQKLLEIEFCRIFYALESRYVCLTLPKFKMEQFNDMKDVLKKLGMESMFLEETADFSEMYDRGENPLYVSEVLHKSVLEVNEEGSEAAAATAAEMDVGLSELDEPEEPLQFKVDHPFIFLILHQNAVLFIGKKSFID